MILVDHQIREAVATKLIRIENFDDKLVQPASYDLRIGPLVYSGSELNPDHPVDLSKNGGDYRIPPYGNVVLMTYEILRFPANIVGRFGLKSGFTRKGFHASTGPQVDPGFEGKLFVTLFNLTPASHIISYKDTFLSIEFHKLDATPEQTYQGPYQGRINIGREILQDLVRFEGLNLSQMQNQFTELGHHIREWSGLAARFDEFLRGMERHTAATERLFELVSRQQIERDAPAPLKARKVNAKKAMKEILGLFKKEKRLYYSDIAEKLRLDFATVIEACEELVRQGLIEGD